MNFLSSVNKCGKVVSQIIHFSGGEKATIEGVITESIVEGEMTKFKTEDGRYILINKKNVNWVEVYGK